MIKASAAVLTITETTAWEGLLYQKPVIAFGPLCYGFANGISTATTGATALYHRSRIEGIPADQEALLRLVAAVLNTAHPGQWHSPLSTPGVLEPANLELIAEAIYRELSELAPPQTPPSMARSQTHVLAR